MADELSDGWAWFEAGPTASNATELQNAFVRTFASDAGHQVLTALRRLTIERRLPPDAPEALLRFVEGQRALVAHIERLSTPDPS
jgi:hypothetical protein